MLIVDWLSYWRHSEPEREALFDAAHNQHYSYRQLADASDHCARQLSAAGFAAGDRLALLAANCPQTLMLLFACARLGVVLVPLNYRLAAAELSFIVADAAPRFLLHDAGCAELAAGVTLSAGCQLLALAEWAHQPAASLPDTATDAEAPVVIQYTSGTTGRPKGVIQSQRMISWNAINTTVSWDLSGRDCALVHTPFFHTGGLHVLTTPLLQRGGKLVLLPAFDAATALRLIDEQRVSILFAVPTMFQMMLDTAEFVEASLGSLRFCISGGAPCPLPLIAAYQARGLVFKQGYGLTEAGPNCMTLHQRLAEDKAGSVGMPNMYTQVRVVGDNGQPVAQGEVGELQLGGPTLCSGYWRNPEATAQLFDAGWLRTGDLVRVDGEGCCYIVDRKKDMFISGGENIYPAEIEAILLLHPAVQEAAVTGIADAKWGEVGQAHVLLRNGECVSGEQLQAFLAAHLARYKLPKSFVFLHQPLPRTPTGKVRKNLLRS